MAGTRLVKHGCEVLELLGSFDQAPGRPPGRTRGDTIRRSAPATRSAADGDRRVDAIKPLVALVALEPPMSTKSSTTCGDRHRLVDPSRHGGSTTRARGACGGPWSTRR
jgi:hypothetical protein